MAYYSGSSHGRIILVKRWLCKIDTKLILDNIIALDNNQDMYKYFTVAARIMYYYYILPWQTLELSRQYPVLHSEHVLASVQVKQPVIQPERVNYIYRIKHGLF